MKLLALTCLLVGYLLSAVENVALDRNFDQSRARSVEEKFNRGAVESRPAVQRPGSFNRAAVESFPSLGLSQRIPLRDAVEGRPPLDSIPAEYDIRDSPLVDSNLIPISAGPNPFLFGPPLPVNFIVKNIPEETVDEPCSNVDTLRGTFDCSRYQMCIHGQWKDQKCPPTLHWNAKTSSCDWPAAAGCTKNIDEWTTETPVTSPARPTEAIQTTTREPVTTPRPSTTTAAATQTTTRKPVTTPKPSTTATGGKKVICYYTNWSWYRTGTGKYSPSDIDVNLCTHVLYGFATLDYSTLLMKVFDTWCDTDEYGPKLYEKVTSLKEQGVKVMIALGGWNDSQGDKYSRMVNDPASRKRFVTNAVEFIEKYGFQGLDLDWEYPKCWQVDCKKGPDSDKDGFAALVGELRQAFNPRGWLLSAAVSPSKSVIDAAYDVPSISRDLDWIGVMTYDYHGHWDKKTGHVAPLYFHSESDEVYYNANYTINYWLRLGAERDKLIMGIPLYGQSFTLSDSRDTGLNSPTYGPGEAGQYTKQGGFLAYYEICKQVTRSGWNIIQDPEDAIGPYAFNGNNWVSFDDADMVRRKSEFIRSINIGGAMIWALDLDDFQNTCGCETYPLLKTINRVLRDYPASSGSCQLKTRLVGNEIAAADERPPVIIRSVCMENSFKSHASDCSSYYSCSNGEWVKQSCPGGLLWNKDRCDWPANTVCEADAQTNVVIPGTVIETSRPLGTATSAEFIQQKPSKTAVGDAKKDFKVVCYFTNWSWYRPGTGKYSPDDIDGALCTHIIYGFTVLDYEKLILKAHDPWADIDNNFFEKVVATKQKGVQKVLVGLGGWNDSEGDKYSRLVNDPAARKKFIRRVIPFIQRYGFDGMDLDWEYPKCWQTNCTAGPDTDRTGFTEWVKELSAAFKPRGWLLTAAVSPSKPIIDVAYDVDIINQYLDWFGIMTYDFFGNWDKETAPAAPLFDHPDIPVKYFNANFSVHYWLEKGADREKLIMGMPMYGQALTLEDPEDNGIGAPASGPGEAGEFTRQDGFLAYYEICQRINQKGWTMVQDPTGSYGPYAYSGDQWTSFDDADMIRRKSEFVRSMNIGGAMIWTLDDDDFANTCGCERHPLLRTINRVLRNYQSPDPGCALKTRALNPLAIENPSIVEPVEHLPSLLPPVRMRIPTQVETDDSSSSGYKVVCYFTNWAIYRKGDGAFRPEDIDHRLCTHILYSFASLDPKELVMRVMDPGTDMRNEFYSKVTAFRQQGIRVSIALGGWNESGGDKFSRMVNNAEARKNFIESAVEFIDTYGFDGLHFDWQYPKCWQADCNAGPDSDKEAFASLIQELRADFQPRGWIVSASVSPSASVIESGYDITSLSRDLDLVIVSAYDYHGNWDGRTGHVAPLYANSRTRSEAVNNNVNYTINYLIQAGADRKKLVMGIPLYGQTFTLADKDDNGMDAYSKGPGLPGHFTRTSGFLPYYEICEGTKRNQWTVVEDEERTMGPYAYHGDQWVSFDNVASVRQKSEFVKSMDLGGAMIWALDLDDFHNRCGHEEYPLLKSINRVLRRFPDPRPFV